LNGRISSIMVCSKAHSACPIALTAPPLMN
jgi:hypothetical protein